MTPVSQPKGTESTGSAVKGPEGLVEVHIATVSEKSPPSFENATHVPSTRSTDSRCDDPSTASRIGTARDSSDCQSAPSQNCIAAPFATSPTGSRATYSSRP